MLSPKPSALSPACEVKVGSPHWTISQPLIRDAASDPTLPARSPFRDSLNLEGAHGLC